MNNKRRNRRRKKVLKITFNTFKVILFCLVVSSATASAAENCLSGKDLVSMALEQQNGTKIPDISPLPFIYDFILKQEAVCIGSELRKKVKDKVKDNATEAAGVVFKKVLPSFHNFLLIIGGVTVFAYPVYRLGNKIKFYFIS